MALEVTPVEARIALLMQRLGREWGFSTPEAIERIAEAATEWESVHRAGPAPDGRTLGDDPEPVGRA